MSFIRLLGVVSLLFISTLVLASLLIAEHPFWGVRFWIPFCLGWFLYFVSLSSFGYLSLLHAEKSIIAKPR